MSRSWHRRRLGMQTSPSTRPRRPESLVLKLPYEPGSNRSVGPPVSSTTPGATSGDDPTEGSPHAGRGQRGGSTNSARMTAEALGIEPVEAMLLARMQPQRLGMLLPSHRSGGGPHWCGCNDAKCCETAHTEPESPGPCCYLGVRPSRSHPDAMIGRTMPPAGRRA